MTSLPESPTAQSLMEQVMFRQFSVSTTDDREEAHDVLNEMVDAIGRQGGRVYLVYLHPEMADNFGVMMIPKDGVKAISENETAKGDNDATTPTIDLLKDSEYVDITHITDASLGSF